MRALSAGDSTVTGFVKYDPTAAQQITANNLFSTAALDAMLNNGKTAVPDFPVTAIALKPVFVTLSNLVGGRYFRLPVWHGPPAVPQAYPSNAWGTYVWIDTQEPGVGTGAGQVDTVGATNGSSRTPGTTYGLGSFINFRLSATQAASLNIVHDSLPALRAPRVQGGDFAVLVGMHVTSREITRWTWQTFWSAPDPDQPPLPSSVPIAADRPAQLTGAPRHYAVAIAYQMVSPDQPNTGGANAGNSVYAYNPYLEAGFGPADLPSSKPGTYNGQPVANNVGMQTNCMSCHAQACYSTSGSLNPAYYTGDQYIDLNGPQFTGNLKVDFLWSVPDTAR